MTRAILKTVLSLLIQLARLLKIFQINIPGKELLLVFDMTVKTSFIDLIINFLRKKFTATLSLFTTIKYLSLI